jgi:hypothetical protein
MMGEMMQAMFADMSIDDRIAWGGLVRLVMVQAYRAAVTEAGFTGAAVRVLGAFGPADITMLEHTPLGGGCLPAFPNKTCTPPMASWQASTSSPPAPPHLPRPRPSDRPLRSGSTR